MLELPASGSRSALEDGVDGVLSHGTHQSHAVGVLKEVIVLVIRIGQRGSTRLAVEVLGSGSLIDGRIVRQNVRVGRHAQNGGRRTAMRDCSDVRRRGLQSDSIIIDC